MHHRNIDIYVNGFLNGNIPSKRYGPDSVYIEQFLDQDKSNRLFHANIPWVDRNNSVMLYRGNPLNRSKAFATRQPCKGDMIPIYRYPGFQWESVANYANVTGIDELDHIMSMINDSLLYRFDTDEEHSWRTVSLNHVIATCYTNGNDNIGAHRDKPQDITPDSVILMLSTGAERELHLTRKSDGEQFCVVLRPGSLFVLGPETNMSMTHAIAPLKDEKILKRDTVGPRVSFVFRNIRTHFHRRHIAEKASKSAKDKAARKKRKEEKARSTDEELNVHVHVHTLERKKHKSDRLDDSEGRERHNK